MVAITDVSIESRPCMYHRVYNRFASPGAPVGPPGRAGLLFSG